MNNWPKRPDGSNMTMGEMTPEQRREQTRASLARLKVEFAPLGVDIEFNEGDPPVNLLVAMKERGIR